MKELFEKFRKELWIKKYILMNKLKDPSLHVRLGVRAFIDYNDLYRMVHISRIKVKRRFFLGKAYEVVIYSNRIGLLIGRKGSTLRELQRWVGEDIKVTLKEFDPFS